MDETTARNILSQMEIPSEYYDDPNVQSRAKKSDAGHIFWSAIEGWRHKTNNTDNSSWNVLFKKTPYNTLYDPGKGIIHSNEPQQLVFLEIGTYEILDLIMNNQSAIVETVKQAFPEFKVINKSKKFGDTYSYYFENPKTKQYFDVEIHKLGNSVSVFVCRDIRKNYIFDEEDSSLIVDDLKEALKKCKSNEYPELDYSKSPIQEIAKTYGFSIEEGAQGINRNYKSKSDNYLLKLGIHYHAPTSYSPDSSLNIVLERNSEDGMYYSIGSYHYYGGIKNPEGNPEEMVAQLLKSIERTAKLDSETDDFDRRYKAKIALKDIEFLEKRVFVKRVK